MFTCTFPNNSFHLFFTLFNSILQFWILEYLYATSFAFIILSSAPNIIETFFSEKLSIVTSISIAMQLFFLIPLSLSNLIWWSDSGSDIPPFPKNVFLFPVNVFIFSLLDTYAILSNCSVLYKFLAITILEFSSYCSFIFPSDFISSSPNTGFT